MDVTSFVSYFAEHFLYSNKTLTVCAAFCWNLCYGIAKPAIEFIDLSNLEKLILALIHCTMHIFSVDELHGLRSYLKAKDEWKTTKFANQSLI